MVIMTIPLTTQKAGYVVLADAEIKSAAILWSLIWKANIMQSFVERIWTIGNIQQTK